MFSKRTLVLPMLLATTTAYAGNEPERGQQRAQEDIVPKVALACGLGALTIRYDGASLREHNQDIKYDQTDGGRTCNEPLRYLWYACQTDAGKKAVRGAGISAIECKGTPAKTGKLTLSKGVFTVERAFEDPKYFVHMRKAFEAQLKVSVKLAQKSDEDPYYDAAWSTLVQAPNPITSTTDYCQVNGEKEKLSDSAQAALIRSKASGKVSCHRAGKLVTELTIKSGLSSGFASVWGERELRTTRYRDGKKHGEEQLWENNVLRAVAQYEDDKRVWLKELAPNGKLLHYDRGNAADRIEVTRKEDGKVIGLRCAASAKGDSELNGLCGFGGAVTTSIYDGTGKTSRIETWLNGQLQKVAPGDSSYAERSAVSFRAGKKHGEERVLSEDGKLAHVIHWNDGVKDGKELDYAQGGEKVVRETLWKAGVVTQITELYLNGNAKRTERFVDAQTKDEQEFWDTGKLSREGRFLRCAEQRYGRYGGFCPEGLHRVYFEDGKLRAEEQYKAGQLHGTSKAFWPSGQPAEVEEYTAGVRTHVKSWDQNGQLLRDDELEADGSRKLK